MPTSVLGRKPYNNGTICKYFYPGEQPDGWVYGYIKRSREDIEKSNAKREKTCLDIYGYVNVRQSPEVQSKAQTTCLLRYGDKNYNNREKMLDTAFDRAGGREAFYTERTKKTRETCQLKWGCDNYAQTKEFHDKFSHCRKYNYNGEYFDSSWELYLWIYACDNNQNIVHLPLRLAYNYNNKVHYYFPDFYYNGELIDIKGPQFISETGSLTALYLSDDAEKIAAKWQCMLDNNVRLFTFEDIKPIINWVDNKYGRNYIKQYSVEKGGDMYEL